MFVKGQPKIAGRKRGTPNKLTASFKEAIRLAYDEIGGHAAFAAWARENPGEFYKIAARLIPAEGGGQVGGVTVVIDGSCGGAVQIMPTNAPATPVLLGQE